MRPPNLPIQSGYGARFRSLDGSEDTNSKASTVVKNENFQGTISETEFNGKHGKVPDTRYRRTGYFEEWRG